MIKSILCVTIILATAVFAFSQDCNNLNKELKTTELIRNGSYALLGLSIAAVGLVVMDYRVSKPPPPGSQNTYSDQRQDNLIGGISIACAITVPVGIIGIIVSHKKIRKLNNKIELNCKENKGN